MDNKTFNSRLAANLACDVATAASVGQSLVDLLCLLARRQDTVAVPGFGTFAPVKTDEQVVRDDVSGKRMLMPPSVKITFKPGSRLKKATSPKS